MRAIMKVYDKMEEYVLVGSLILTVILVFTQVIMRYVFNNSLSWSEEMTRYIFIWQIWLGASIGLRDRKHIKVEVLQSILKPKAKLILDIISNLIWMASCIYLTYSGTLLVLNIMSKNSISTALSLPLWIVYAALPVSSFIIVIRQLILLYDDVVTIKNIGKGI